MTYGGGRYHIQCINQKFGQILSISRLSLDSIALHVGCQGLAKFVALFLTFSAGQFG